MTTLNYLTIGTNLLSMAIMLRLIARPSIVGWPPRTTQITCGVTAILNVFTIVLTLINHSQGAN